MLLTKVVLNDFGVYRGRNEFNFKTTKDKPVILIGGTNGAGKTTLFESVMLCLYGQDSFEEKISQKQYHQRILRTIHRFLGTKKSADEASIIVEFQFAHSGKIIEYQVMRVWQNNGGKIDETLTIKKRELGEENFLKLDSLEESEWQVFIDQLLPNGITKLFFFDGEKIQSIADTGDEDVYIKSSFDTLLGLDLVKQLIADIGITILRNSTGETKKILDEIDLQTKEKKASELKRDNAKNKQANLKGEILILQKKLAVQEEDFKKRGGSFAERREALYIDKAKLESKLETIAKQMRELCSTILPFALIPKQLEELKNEIKNDQQKIQNKYEKNILKKNFQELSDEINSSKFLSEYDDKIKQKFVKELQEILQNKIKSISKIPELSYNFSSHDMEQIFNMIDDVNESAEKKIEELAKSHNIIMNSRELNKVSLESAPKDDEIGTIFTKLTETSGKIGELENELENQRAIESQERTIIMLLNSKIRINLTKRHVDNKRLAGLGLAPKVQDVLEDYAKILRNKKLESLEKSILNGLQMLLHKKDFIEKVVINKETFEIKLFKGNDDEITKDMLSKGELQMYSTAIVRGLAKTSERPLPFMIDTPLARLDEEHRKSLVENFYPDASHQIIILSTDSEINYEHYQQLKPYISKSYLIQYDSDKGKTIIHDNYFFDEKGEKIIEVQ